MAFVEREMRRASENGEIKSLVDKQMKAQEESRWTAKVSPECNYFVHSLYFYYLLISMEPLARPVVEAT